MNNRWFSISIVAILPLMHSATYAEPAVSSPQEVVQTQVDLEALRDKYYKNLPAIEFDRSNALTESLANSYITKLTWLSNELKRELPMIQEHNAKTDQGKWLRGWMEKGIYEKIKMNNGRFDQQVSSHVRSPISILEKAENIDQETFRENYSNEEQRKRFEEKFSRTSETLHAASILQQAMNSGDSYKKAAIRVDNLIEKWNDQVAGMSTGRSLPRDIGNEGLTNIAEGVLAEPKYGIEPWERLIVNSGVKPGKRIEHQIEQDKLVTIVRRWEEYQVTTVELEDGKYILYYNTLKNFSDAPNPTPVNTWILGKRVKGGEISRAKI